MIKIKVTQELVEHVEAYICDICEEVCKDFEYVTVNAHWGYFSSMDGQQHTGHVCEHCYLKHIFPLFKANIVKHYI